MKTIQIRSTDYRAYPIVYKSGVIKDKERETKRRSDETMETPSS